MDYLGLLKGATEIVVSIGASSIVGNAVKLTKSPDAKLPMRIATGIGAFVLSSMIGDVAGRYATKQIDDVAGRIKDIFRKVDDETVNENSEQEGFGSAAADYVDPDDKSYKQSKDLLEDDNKKGE